MPISIPSLRPIDHDKFDLTKDLPKERQLVSWNMDGKLFDGYWYDRDGKYFVVLVEDEYPLIYFSHWSNK